MTGAEKKRHTGDDAVCWGVPGRSIVSTDKAAAARPQRAPVQRQQRTMPASQAMAAGAGKPGRVGVSGGRNALQAPMGR